MQFSQHFKEMISTFITFWTWNFEFIVLYLQLFQSFIISIDQVAFWDCYIILFSILGLLGYSSSLRKKNILIIAGGFHGSVTGDVLAYTLPNALSMKRNDKVCSLYGSQIRLVQHYNQGCRWNGWHGYLGGPVPSTHIFF